MGIRGVHETNVSELWLFKKEIKPAILIPQRSLGKLDLDINKYYTAVFRAGIILSHKNLPVITNRDNVKLGIVLGYYPRACELLYDKTVKIIENELIDFGGIKFNTANIFEECFEWCIREYKEKMLNYHDRIVVKHWGNKREGKKLISHLIKTIIIER